MHDEVHKFVLALKLYVTNNNSVIFDKCKQGGCSVLGGGVHLIRPVKAETQKVGHIKPAYIY